MNILNIFKRKKERNTHIEVLVGEIKEKGRPPVTPIIIEPDPDSYEDAVLNSNILFLVRTAAEFGWKVSGVLIDARRLVFSRNKVRLEINWNGPPYTVGTSMFHVKKGNSRLIRSNLTYDEVRKVFDNPRFHTGKGRA